MSWFWLAVWLGLSAFVIGAFGWTTRILFQQKKGWADFAARHKLQYNKGPLLGSPSMQGAISGYRVGVYSEQQRTPDARGVRFRTAIEISAHVRMPTVGAVGTGDISALLGPLDMRQSYAPRTPYWNEKYFLKSHDSVFLESFLTEERLKALDGFFRLKSATAIFLFDRQNMLLRLETPDPFVDPKRLNALVGKMIDFANQIFPRGGVEAPTETPDSSAPPA